MAAGAPTLRPNGWSAVTPSAPTTSPTVTAGPTAATEDLAAVHDRITALADGRALPLWPYELTTDDDEVTAAFNGLVDDCLRSEGVVPPEPRPQQPPAAAVTWLVVPDPRRGYHEPVDPGFAAWQAADAAWAARHPDPPDADYQLALTGTTDGTGSGGCMATAWQRLGGTGQALVVRTGTKALEESTWDAATRDPEFVAARREWSRCMTAAGYPATDPWTLSATVRDGRYPGVPFDPDATTATPAEQSLARADLRCADSSRLWDVFWPRLHEEQRTAIRAHEADLAAPRAVLDRIRAKAREYLAQRGPTTAG